MSNFYVKLNSKGVATGNLIPEAMIKILLGSDFSDETLKLNKYAKIEDTSPIVEEFDSIEYIGYKLEGNKYVLDYKITHDLEIRKIKKIEFLKQTYNAELPVMFKEMYFNGGQSSASSIMSAVTLSQVLGDTSVGIWNLNNEVIQLTHAEATELAKIIGKEYRDAMYKRQKIISDINALTTLEEINAFSIADAVVPVVEEVK